MDIRGCAFTWSRVIFSWPISCKLGRRVKDQSADPGLEFPRSACNGRNTEEYGAEG